MNLSDHRTEARGSKVVRLSGVQAHGDSSAFTLIELLVVIGIMGIMIGIGIPVVYHRFHRDSMELATDELMKACDQARANAILQGVTTELRIRPGDRQVSVVTIGNVNEPREDGGLSGLGGSGEEWRMEESHPAGGASIYSFRFSDKILVEGLGINGLDWTDDEEGGIRFYPNGTSDEMSVVLQHRDTGVERNVWLEVVTALASYEVDVHKFKAR